jgi:integrase
MYTYIPPLRADFGEVRINPPQSLIKSKHANYILINSKSATLVIRDFKTASKYKAITHELQPEFVKEINASLLYEPRKYLFVMPSDISRPYDRNGFSKWANKVLQEIFKVPITLTSLRHIFISTLDFSKMRVLEMEKIAHQMGHSLGMQKQYQWLE